MCKYRLVVGALLISAGLWVCVPAQAQSFRVQCPDKTALHPGAKTDKGSIKCQHIAGSDGFATMADGNQIYLFGFAPLSGLEDIQGGLPGTELASTFNKPYSGPIVADLSSATHPAGGNVNAAIREPAMLMNMGVLAANAPAPLIAIDEDDELYLTLSNVGMIMRPDLFEQHTVHFHGYPNASSYFDGVPDASVAINIAGSFTYYYTAPDAGTYFWHCHITPPEHLQMGMVGQLFVRPRQNQVPKNTSLRDALVNTYKHSDGTTYDPCVADVLCSSPIPPAQLSPVKQPAAGAKYAYNDGDGSTQYDVEYPLQMMGFDPNFHFVGMTFNPEAFADMKDKYFLLNGRSYPDTVTAGVIATAASDGVSRPAQPLPAAIIIDKTHGQKRALLRISDLSVTEFSTLATVGVPMKVIGFHARMLRDEAGNNMFYDTNSITIGGGESIDVILDVSDPAYTAGQTFFLYSTNLDHLSNDAENFGGMMTEIRIL
ncbi:MAG: multicopper oxidase type 2 [Gammaproteobacteria bacterium]|nr:multicopper oxidase type 2 [Gammaproteobacteria bacterium]